MGWAEWPPPRRWEKRLSPGCWGGGVAAPHSSQVRGTPLSLRPAARPPPPTWLRIPLAPSWSWHPLAPRRLTLISPGLSLGSGPAPPHELGASRCGRADPCAHPTSPNASVSGSRASRLTSSCPARPAGVGLLPPLHRSPFAALTPHLSPAQSFGAPSPDETPCYPPSHWVRTFALTSTWASLLQAHPHPCPLYCALCISAAPPPPSARCPGSCPFAPRCLPLQTHLFSHRG